MRMIDTRNGELHLDRDGNWLSVTALEALRQKIERKLKLFRAEWFLDVESGVPYFQQIFERPNTPGLTSSILAREILEEPEVTAIAVSDFTFNPQTRQSTYSAQVSSIYGEFEVRV